MPTDFNTLFSQYNSAVARNKDLQSQIQTKEKQWARREEEFNVTEKLIKELCEKILATDRDMLKLGKSKPISSYPINEIIRKTDEAYMKYRAEQSEIISKFLQELESRRDKIESLEAQLSRTLTHSGGELSREDLARLIEKEKQEKEAIKKLPAGLKGTSGVIVQIVEEDRDNIDKDEEDLYADIDDMNESVKLTPISIPSSSGAKTLAVKKKYKKMSKERALTHEVNLEEYKEKITPAGWAVMEVIGKEGLSAYIDIEPAVLRKNKMFKTSAVRSAITVLSSLAILQKEKISSPIKKTITLYELTVLGERIYYSKFNEDPVPSEMSRIAKEHDNYHHGYGIKYLAEAIRETEMFVDVKDDNRKSPIPLGNNIMYVPDIVCTDSNDKKLYIEYECGNTTQTDFNAKCSKMSMVTDILNIVGPNRDVIGSLKAQCAKWIENKGKTALGRILIRIASADQLVGTNIIENKSWKYVFSPFKKGSEPYTNY